MRIIISSATLEARSLAAYFGSHAKRAADGGTPAAADVSRAPAVISVEGRTFDVQVVHLPLASAGAVTSVMPLFKRHN